MEIERGFVRIAEGQVHFAGRRRGRDRAAAFRLAHCAPAMLQRPEEAQSDQTAAQHRVRNTRRICEPLRESRW